MSTLTNAEVREALQGSIQKWERIVAGKGGDRGTDNCPLCQVFLVTVGEMCGGCPVSVYTGLTSCRATPYDEWARCPGFPSRYNTYAETPRQIRAAKAMLCFLKNLDKTYFVHGAAYDDKSKLPIFTPWPEKKGG